MKAVQQSSYFLRVGAEYLNKAAIPDAFNQITLSRRTGGVVREAFSHFMFDESGSIAGGRIAFGLLKNSSTLESADSCKYWVYKVSNDATPWADTLVKSGSLALGADKLFKVTLDETEAGVEIQGSQTFRVRAKLTYNGRPYYLNEYFNHIGLTDKVERVRKKVTFLQITKKDVGQ